MLNEIKGDRPAHELAKQIGCSEALLSFVLTGKRLAGPTILKFLGLERVKTEVTYRKRNGSGKGKRHGL
jgi:hypothetical protein